MAASGEHDRLEGTDIVTLCPNVMGESAEGLLWGSQRTRVAEPWLTRNLVQKFKTRRGTQTSTCASAGHKGAMYICTLSLSLSMSLSLPSSSSSSPLTAVCLCSWNGEGELVQRKTEKTDRDDDIGLVYLYRIFQIKVCICSGDIQNELFLCVLLSLSPTARRMTRLFITQNIEKEKNSTCTHHKTVSRMGRIVPQRLVLDLHVPSMIFDIFLCNVGSDIYMG